MSREGRWLTGIFWACALALWPFRPFPLGDDWAYAEAVRRLVQEGSLRLSDWGAPTLVFQVLWGRIFCLGGFSYEALRLSTLVLAWIGVLSFHRTLRRLGAAPSASLAGALVLLFNPLFFVLGFTFMTDVQALAWMLLAAEASVAAAQERDDTLLLAAGVLGACAYLVRQTGLGIPLGAALWLAARGVRSPRAYLLLLGAPLAAVAGHAAWTATSGPTLAFERYAVAGTLQHLATPGVFLADALRRFSGAALYLGLFLLPFAADGRFPPGTRRSVGWALLPGALGAACWAFGLAPATGNVVGRFGLGTCTLGENCAFKAAGVFGQPAFWLAATALALGVVTALAFRFRSELDSRQATARARPATAAPDGLLPLFSSGFLLAFLLSLLGRDYYDRYFLPLFPAAIAAAALASSGSWKRLAPGLAVLAVWSLAGTGDYLQWNSAKWEGGRRLQEAGLAPEDISNGQEWDALHAYERRIRAARAGLARSPGGGSDLADWWEPGNYRGFTSFAPRNRSEALRKVGEVPYWSPLTLRKESIHLWRLK